MFWLSGSCFQIESAETLDTFTFILLGSLPARCKKSPEDVSDSLKTLSEEFWTDVVMLSLKQVFSVIVVCTVVPLL